MIHLQGQGVNPDRWYSPRAIFHAKVSWSGEIPVPTV